ncbi:hypothetical protein K0M31_020295, partial [Melipona bicolor]
MMEIDVVKTFETIGHSSYVKVTLKWRAERRYDSTLISGYRLFDAGMATFDEVVCDIAFGRMRNSKMKQFNRNTCVDATQPAKPLQKIKYPLR